MLALASIAWASGCAGDAGHGVRASDAWTRPTPPGVTTAAIYLRIDNGTDVDDALVGGDASPCLVLSPHLTMTDAAGTSSMIEPTAQATEIPAGGRLDLVPQGLHLMCYGLTAPLIEGQQFAITLHFRSGANAIVNAVVTRR